MSRQDECAYLAANANMITFCVVLVQEANLPA